MKTTNGGAPRMLAPEEIAEAVREYRIRRQQQSPSGPVRPWLLQPPKPLVLWTDVECIAYLCLMCESVAHLQGHERAILPITDRVYAWLDNRETGGPDGRLHDTETEQELNGTREIHNRG